MRYRADMATGTKDRSFQMRVDEAWLAKVDDWRRREPDLPPRAEAIRRLVELGLEARPKGEA